jgi:hypothetical protein
MASSQLSQQHTVKKAGRLSIRPQDFDCRYESGAAGCG